MLHKEQGCGMMRNATEQRTMPQLKEQCHSIPLHGKKCHGTMHNSAAKAVAQCAMKLHTVAAGRMTANTEWQWQCQQQCNSNANNDTKPLLHSLIPSKEFN